MIRIPVRYKATGERIYMGLEQQSAWTPINLTSITNNPAAVLIYAVYPDDVAINNLRFCFSESDPGNNKKMLLNTGQYFFIEGSQNIKNLWFLNDDLDYAVDIVIELFEI
jgi:hypothetical protein